MQCSYIHNLNAFIKRLHRQEAYRPGHKDFSVLDEQTWTYLHLDKQRLQEELDQASQSQDKKQTSRLQSRLKRYYVIENFFFTWLNTTPPPPSRRSRRSSSKISFKPKLLQRPKIRPFKS